MYCWLVRCSAVHANQTPSGAQQRPQHNTAQHSTAQNCTALHSTAQYSTIRYSTASDTVKQKMAHLKPHRSTFEDYITSFGATLTVDPVQFYPTLLITTPFYSILLYSIPPILSYSTYFYSVPLYYVSSYSILLLSAPLQCILTYHVLLFYILFFSALFHDVLLRSFLSPTLSYLVTFYSSFSLLSSLF